MGSYGYGSLVGSQNGHRCLRMTGRGSGFAAQLSRYPDDDVTIIFLSNQQSVANILGVMEEEVLRMVLGS
jgi:hypothetical protein